MSKPPAMRQEILCPTCGRRLLGYGYGVSVRRTFGREISTMPGRRPYFEVMCRECKQLALVEFAM